MRQLPEGMYEVHSVLKQYVAVHDALFKKFSLAAVFKPIPFGVHEAKLALLVERLDNALTSIAAEPGIPRVFIEYVAALKAAVESLQKICANLERKSRDPTNYKYGSYREDVGAYHAMEARYQSLGTTVNQLITF